MNMSMKNIKWKSLIMTWLVTLLGIIPGIVFWNELPESVAIHFNIHNQADGFSSKGFAVFGLTLMMVALQAVCCIITDINSHKHGERAKFESVVKWILPVMTIVLQIITVGYNVGMNIDIRKAVAVIVGLMFVVMGNYMPKFDYIKNYNTDTQKARKINRVIGFEMVIMGLLAIVTAFLPSLFTLIWLFSLIPYAILNSLYVIKCCKKD